MPLYRIIVSFEVEADDEEAAAREAQNVVHDDTMVVESVSRRPEPQSYSCTTH